jgi:hypothetical protein
MECKHSIKYIKKGGNDMLFMIVGTHTPQTCPAVVPELAKKVKASYQRMGEVSKKLGITEQGIWTDMPAHTIFTLVDAPNAHVLGQLAMELNLMEWNTSIVHPVIPLKEAMERIK